MVRNREEMTIIENVFWEWCPNCTEEAELPLTFNKHECPNCKHLLLPCSLCVEDNCSSCPFKDEQLK